MQGVPRKDQLRLQSRRPAGLDEFQISTALAAAVNFVTDQRMTRMGGMHTDLMRATGARKCADRGKLPPFADKAPHDTELRACLRAAGMDTTLQPDRRIADLALADDRRVDRLLIPLRPTADHGDIFFADAAALHGEAERPCAFGSEREQDQSARFAIKSRDDGKLAAVGQLVGEQLPQPVPERRSAIRPRRVREKARGFVHDNPVLALGHHAEVVLRAPLRAETLVIPMISLRHVSRVYPSPAGEVHALRDVSLEIEPFSFCAVTGSSGCGKSTLLNLLGGLDQPTSGEIVVDGLALHNADENALTAYRRGHLGIVFQFFNLLPAMTALENVELPLLLRGDRAKEARIRAAGMLELVGLTPRAGAFPHQMSGGEMQRAAVARALVHGPSLLLADEPTGNLDSDNAARILELFQKIASQRLTTLIMVTHSPEAAAAATRRIPMMDGRLAH